MDAQMNSSNNAAIAILEREELLAFVYDIQLLNYICLAAVTITFFDYLITIDSEVKLIWGRKLSWAKMIFFLNRYLSLVSYVVASMMIIFADTSASCNTLVYLYETTNVILSVVWAAFSGLRIYVISHRNRIVTIIVVLCALVPVASNTYLETQLSINDTPLFGCIGQTTPIALGLWTKLATLTRGLFAIAEALVVIVTWSKTWRTVHQDSPVGIKFSFSALIFREGITYFVFILVNSILVIVGLTGSLPPAIYGIINASTIVIPILISRFYFNLDDLQYME